MLPFRVIFCAVFAGITTPVEVTPPTRTACPSSCRPAPDWEAVSETPFNATRETRVACLLPASSRPAWVCRWLKNRPSSVRDVYPRIANLHLAACAILHPAAPRVAWACRRRRGSFLRSRASMTMFLRSRASMTMIRSALACVLVTEALGRASAEALDAKHPRRRHRRLYQHGRVARHVIRSALHAMAGM